MDFLSGEKFDGVYTTPREPQRIAADWLSDNWDKSNIFVIQGPVGMGKSGLARAIQIHTEGDIITPSNVLIDQYTSTYTDVNYLKGKERYTCKSGLSCKDWKDQMKKYCEGCPYASCRSKAEEGEATFFNPMSKYHMRRSAKDVMIVDEMHQLNSMMLMLCGKKFRHSLYKFDEKTTNEIYFVKWLGEVMEKLIKLKKMYFEAGDIDRVKDIVKEIDSAMMVKKGIEESSQNYVIWIENGYYRKRPEKFLNVMPLKPPKFITKKILDSHKLIMMSGSIMPHDVRELVHGDPFLKLDLKSPIPAENRPVYFAPFPHPMNYKTPPAMIAKSIMAICNRPENLGQNTIIHVPYSMSRRLIEHMPEGTLSNTPEDKEEKLEEFKKKGGLFLASGCAEGLDLKDDLCRVNIIPKLPFPNMKDPVVEKRMSLEDGQQWFELETLKTVIQQVGRSTRNESDWSRTYIGDRSFAKLFNKNKKLLPQSFNEAIQWNL